MQIGLVNVHKFRAGLYERLAVALTKLTENDGLLDKEKAETASIVFIMMEEILESPPPYEKPQIKAVPPQQQTNEETKEEDK